MLKVITLEEARRRIAERFVAGAAGFAGAAGVAGAAGGSNDTRAAGVAGGLEEVALQDALGRYTGCNTAAREGVPAFDRSTVDGYAVHAEETFGCSESMPALLQLGPDVHMGETPEAPCEPGFCCRISTGGMLPKGADAVVMLEYAQEYGDGTVGLMKPAAPGANVVYKHDDLKPGQTLVEAGTRLLPHHIGSLASLGVTKVQVLRPLKVGIISSGDEISPFDEPISGAQMRDVNTPLLESLVRACGAEPVSYGIVPDDVPQLSAAVERAAAECDAVLLSGGTSVSAHDGTPRVLAKHGELLFHGLAVKPGKPTLCADAEGVPLFGLPGHPAAAYYIFCELVAPLLEALSGTSVATAADNVDGRVAQVAAELAEALPSNHGRAEFVPVRLKPGEGTLPLAQPVRSKSGLISQLLDCDGYITIPRDSEGLPKGAAVCVRNLLG